MRCTQLPTWFVVVMISVQKADVVVVKTLIATGIAFNVILIRSSPSRDRQFTMFDHNERFDSTQPSKALASSIHFMRPEVELVDTKTEHRTDERLSSQVSI